jgi:hypothetical protein
MHWLRAPHYERRKTLNDKRNSTSQSIRLPVSVVVVVVVC